MKKQVIELITNGLNQSELHKKYRDNWNVPVIYSLYCEYIKTGSYPYLSSVVKFIADKFEMKLTAEQESNLTSHIYFASKKYREERDAKNREEMIQAGWLLVDEQVVKQAVDNGKKIILNGKRTTDWLTTGLGEKPYRPILDRSGKYFLIAPGKRNRGYFLHNLTKPGSEHDTFCKLI